MRDRDDESKHAGIDEAPVLMTRKLPSLRFTVRKTSSNAAGFAVFAKFSFMHAVLWECNTLESQISHPVEFETEAGEVG